MCWWVGTGEEMFSRRFSERSLFRVQQFRVDDRVYIYIYVCVCVCVRVRVCVCARAHLAHIYA